jgi:hypothetical protein
LSLRVTYGLVVSQSPESFAHDLRVRIAANPAGYVVTKARGVPPPFGTETMIAEFSRLWQTARRYAVAEKTQTPQEERQNLLDEMGL